MRSRARNVFLANAFPQDNWPKETKLDALKPEKNDATVLVRLPADLKAALMRSAFVSGRRITAEINLRLANSLREDPDGMKAVTTMDYTPAPAPKPSHTGEPAPGQLPTQLIELVRRLTPEKQAALLSLLK